MSMVKRRKPKKKKIILKKVAIKFVILCKSLKALALREPSYKERQRRRRRQMGHEFGRESRKLDKQKAIKEKQRWIARNGDYAKELLNLQKDRTAKLNKFLKSTPGLWEFFGLLAPPGSPRRQECFVLLLANSDSVHSMDLLIVPQHSEELLKTLWLAITCSVISDPSLI